MPRKQRSAEWWKAYFDAHLELFAARHDRGEKLGHEDVLRAAVEAAGLDADAVAAEVASGRPLKTLGARGVALNVTVSPKS